MRRRAGTLALLCGFAVATTVAQRGAPRGQWPAYGGDFGSSKYSALDQITRDNAQRLKVVWRWESVDNQVVKDNRRSLPAFPAAFKSTPIMTRTPGCAGAPPSARGPTSASPTRCSP